MVGERQVPVVLVRNARARRYILRLRPDGSACVTIPRGGSAAAAQQFVARSTVWLQQAIQRQTTRSQLPREWSVGTTVLFRGARQVIELPKEMAGRAARFGTELVALTGPSADLRPAIEQHLQNLATQELPPRVRGYAAQYQLAVHRITVRNQKSRWGSCSRRRTISLNWRLIQTPPFVQDYIILHELMHLRQMNHSARFWQEVKSVCPDYESAERWLKQNAALLR
jgi:predicted metal-dependent hydrolase